MTTLLFNASAQAGAQQRVYLDESGTLGYSGEIFTMALVLVRDLPKLETCTLKNRVTQSEVKASQMKTAQKLALARTLLDENDIQIYLAQLDPLAAMVCERKLDKEFLYDSMVAQCLAFYLERGDMPRDLPYRVSMDMRGGLRESYEDMVGESVATVLMHRSTPLVTSLDVRFLDSRYSAGVQAADLFSNIYRTSLTQTDSPCTSFLDKYAAEGRVHAGFAFGLPELADQMTQIASDLRARVEMEHATSAATSTSASAPADASMGKKAADEHHRPLKAAQEPTPAATVLAPRASEPEQAVALAPEAASATAAAAAQPEPEQESKAAEGAEARGAQSEAEGTNGTSRSARRRRSRAARRERETGGSADVQPSEASETGTPGSASEQPTASGATQQTPATAVQAAQGHEPVAHDASPAIADATPAGTATPAAPEKPAAKLPFAPARDMRPGRAVRMKQSLAAQKRAEKLAARTQSSQSQPTEETELPADSAASTQASPAKSQESPASAQQAFASTPESPASSAANSDATAAQEPSSTASSTPRRARTRTRKPAATSASSADPAPAAAPADSAHVANAGTTSPDAAPSPTSAQPTAVDQAAAPASSTRRGRKKAAARTTAKHTEPDAKATEPAQAPGAQPDPDTAPAQDAPNKKPASPRKPAARRSRKASTVPASAQAADAGTGSEAANKTAATVAPAPAEPAQS